MPTDDPKNLTGLALVAHHATSMADEFALKGDAARCAGGIVTMPPETAKDAAAVIRAYVGIATALEISRDAMRARAEAAEVEAAKAAIMVQQLDQLSLLGLIFLRIGRDKK